MEERVIFNTLDSARKMSQDTHDFITEYNRVAEEMHAVIVPMELYEHGYAPLGAANRSSVARMVKIAEAIAVNNLPIPPSRYVEMLARRIGGESKQDYSSIMDGPKGSGKSYSSAYIGGRFALCMAEIYGGDPYDYFSIENCCLLEDTREIVNLLSKSKNRQYITIDDAGLAVGSRDFADQKNKNFNKIHATCRTKRWCLTLNAPVGSHIDLQIREVVTGKLNCFGSYHSSGFNLLKINSSGVRIHLNKKYPIEKRLWFDKKKFYYWVAYSPDILPPYKGFTKEYDKRRDSATDRVIAAVVSLEELKEQVDTKRDKEWRGIKKKFIPLINKTIEADGGKTVVTHIMKTTGLSQYRVYQLISAIEQGEEY